jgi:uncharacterized Ntn-hydrolase superfamily protein
MPAEAFTMRIPILVLLFSLTAQTASATWSVIAVDRSTGTVVIASATCVPQQGLERFPAKDLRDIQAIVVPGVGVAAAQASVDNTRKNQQLIFAELRNGTAPARILEMLRDDPRFASRQFAIIDLEGRMAGHSGDRNLAVSLDRQGQVDGTGISFSIQGNILATEAVVTEAVRAFTAARGTLADRVMAAMEAADAQGGDKRCSCEGEPKVNAPCTAKTAHVAYILAAEKGDRNGASFNDGQYSLYLSVTDRDITPEENANPVKTLRMRYDKWKQSRPAPRGPIAHTFSIVARDPATGQLGVAVQSHWFSVGSIVSWAEAGVGAIATQSFVDPAYGPRGLDLMRRGTAAPAALEQLVAADKQPDGRQVAMIDANGRVSAYTGKAAIAAAGHQIGPNFAVQANMMANDRVWPAMAKAFGSTTGDLADRLLAALEAAQAAGGDLRGRQSAAILVVHAKNTGRPWAGADRAFDLRVDDHPDPIGELRRLVRLQRAYGHANRGDELMTEQKVDEALKEYAAASQIAPEIQELPFWHAVTLASIGREAEAAPIFRAVFAKEPQWLELLGRLPAAGLFPNDPALLARIRALAK